jgi:hypothetical protein
VLLWWLGVSEAPRRAHAGKVTDRAGILKDGSCSEGREASRARSALQLADEDHVSESFPLPLRRY